MDICLTTHILSFSGVFRGDTEGIAKYTELLDPLMTRTNDGNIVTFSELEFGTVEFIYCFFLSSPFAKYVTPFTKYVT